MPIKEGFDKKENKNYVKYGASGTKYYYNKDSERSHQIATSKAIKQGAAIHISQQKSKSKNIKIEIKK